VAKKLGKRKTYQKKSTASSARRNSNDGRMKTSANVEALKGEGKGTDICRNFSRGRGRGHYQKGLSKKIWTSYTKRSRGGGEKGWTRRELQARTGEM